MPKSFSRKDRFKLIQINRFGWSSQDRGPLSISRGHFQRIFLVGQTVGTDARLALLTETRLPARWLASWFRISTPRKTHRRRESSRVHWNTNNAVSTGDDKLPRVSKPEYSSFITPCPRVYFLAGSHVSTFSSVSSPPPLPSRNPFNHPYDAVPRLKTVHKFHPILHRLLSIFFLFLPNLIHLSTHLVPYPRLDKWIATIQKPSWTKLTNELHEFRKRIATSQSLVTSVYKSRAKTFRVVVINSSERSTENNDKVTQESGGLIIDNRTLQC